jgi:WXXGXW repeat (2 copies)
LPDCNYQGIKGFDGTGACEGGAQPKNPERFRKLPRDTREVMAMKLLKILPLAVLALAVLAMPSASQAQVAVGISVRIGPPPIPVYVQPLCPVEGYMWIPGYWAYGPDGYYWVPGTWVPAPAPGLLWTPGYWGWGEGVYVWHRGYWGPHVGFYGGINYGFGYTGVGFHGGYWRGERYYYNRSVTNINVTVIHNTYNERVVNREVSRVSFNGGRGGIMARPNHDQIAAEHERRFGPTAVQDRHRDAAGRDHSMWASENHGRPSVAASPRPGEFRGRGGVPGNEGRNNANRPAYGNRNGGENRPDAANRQMNRPPNRNDRPPNAMNERRSENNYANHQHGNGNQPGRERDVSQPNRTYPNDSRPPQNAGRANQSHANQPRPEQRPQQMNRAHENQPRPEHNNVRPAERPPANEHQNAPKSNNKPDRDRGNPHGR